MRRFIGNLIRASDRMLPSWLHNDIAFLIAGSALTIVIGGQFDLFERFAAFSAKHERWNIDEFALVFISLSIQALIIAALRYRLMKREHARRVVAEQTMSDLALADSLTELPNRRAFHRVLQNLTEAGNGSCVLFMIDLDRFKPVNDLYGHGVGDTVLRELSARLRNVSQGAAIFARLGGDEFAVLYSGAQTLEMRTAIATRILAEMEKPVRIGAIVCTVGASIGIATCAPDAALSGDELMRRADLALYRAKGSGRGTFCHFRDEMSDQLAARKRLEHDLQRALSNGEIRAHYQPLVRLSDGRVEGFEVLARWLHPDLGMIMPDAFIPIAEDTGLIQQMTMALIREACSDPMHQAGQHYLAINISASLLNRDLCAHVVKIIQAVGFPAERLELEITESALINDIEAAGLVLAQLRRAGFSLALDDFGTGYSSLTHLRKLPINKIKIDQSFIATMTHNPTSRKIVEALVSLAASMDVEVTAEGVETSDMAFQLRDIGCLTAQGYYFGRPSMPSSVNAFSPLAHDQLERLKAMIARPDGEQPPAQAVNVSGPATMGLARAPRA
ncbi:putative bifunctional diguanylate cyclase/phosphodiesterase [Hyphomonas oceanitis]|uniref:putative bifunctional diguanylate cyclase/phosphodiesterase n=1 Tax=Hyphomonas oceanitis TaxID=81033 RepID=UPI0030039BAC